jgi:hypothetical protein
MDEIASAAMQRLAFANLAKRGIVVRASRSGCYQFHSSRVFNLGAYS